MYSIFVLYLYIHIIRCVMGISFGTLYVCVFLKLDILTRCVYIGLIMENGLKQEICREETLRFNYQIGYGRCNRISIVFFWKLYGDILGHMIIYTYMYIYYIHIYYIYIYMIHICHLYQYTI